MERFTPVTPRDLDIVPAPQLIAALMRRSSTCSVAYRPLAAKEPGEVKFFEQGDPRDLSAILQYALNKPIEGDTYGISRE